MKTQSTGTLKSDYNCVTPYVSHHSWGNSGVSFGSLYDCPMNLKYRITIGRNPVPSSGPMPNKPKDQWLTVKAECIIRLVTPDKTLHWPNLDL